MLALSNVRYVGFYEKVIKVKADVAAVWIELHSDRRWRRARARSFEMLQQCRLVLGQPDTPLRIAWKVSNHVDVQPSKFPTIDDDVDHDFATMMIPHHQGAIDMAKAELTYGKDPIMRRLAEEIIVDQQSEITAMQFWINKNAAFTAEEK